MSHSLSSRAALVAEIRTRLLSESFPRVTIFVIVAIAGGCAFLFSALTLSAGLHSMAVRYGLAELAAPEARSIGGVFFRASSRHRLECGDSVAS